MDTNTTVADLNTERLIEAAYKPDLVPPAFAAALETKLVEQSRRQAMPSLPAMSPSPAVLAGRVRWTALAFGALAACILIAYVLSSKPERPHKEGPKNGDEAKKKSTVPDVAPPQVQAAKWTDDAANGMMPRKRPDAPPLKPLTNGERLTTAAGQQRLVQLADGTRLYADEKTEVEAIGARDLMLHKGQIYVEVAPRDEAFVVRAGNREVVATGTHFAVLSDPVAAGVVVTQGRVAVKGIAEEIVAGRQVERGQYTVSAAPRASHTLEWTRSLLAAAESPMVPACQHAGGALIALDPRGQELKLALRQYHVDVHIEDGFARTTIDQTYFNTTWERLEGTFYFPLPADASLSRLAMYVVDGNQCKLMEGGMAERKHAADVYETIRYQRRDPALLEWLDGSTFKMRVFPLEAKQEKRILLSYTQKLSSLYGTSRYRFAGGHSLPVVREYSFNARIKNGALMTVACPTHPDAQITPGGDTLVQVFAKNAKPEGDVAIEMKDKNAGVNDDVPRFTAFMHENQQYLMLRYRPTLKNVPARQRRDWIVLFETSAGRDPLLAGTQIEVLKQVLKNAEYDDTLTVLTVNSKAQQLGANSGPLRGSARQAIEALQSAHLVGALDLQAGLEVAVKLAKDAKNPHVLHIGAGIPAMGERDAGTLARMLPESVRYVGVGVGKRWNRAFMKAAAERTSGLFTQVNPDETIAWRAFDLVATLNTPRLLDVQVVDGAGKAPFLMETSMLAQGEELCAITRVETTRPMPGKVTVKATLDGKPFVKEFPVMNVLAGGGYLPRIWAKQEIDRLLTVGAAKHKDEIIALSKAMYVMSPFTSLLVLETDADYERFKVDKGRKDHWAMYPAPAKIPLVYEPDGKPPVKKKEPKKSDKPPVDEVLGTIVNPDVEAAIANFLLNSSALFMKYHQSTNSSDRITEAERAQLRAQLLRPLSTDVNPGIRDVLVRAEEARTGSLMLGSGINSDNGLGGMIAVDSSVHFPPVATWKAMVKARKEKYEVSRGGRPYTLTHKVVLKENKDLTEKSRRLFYDIEDWRDLRESQGEIIGGLDKLIVDQKVARMRTEESERVPPAMKKRISLPEYEKAARLSVQRDALPELGIMILRGNNAAEIAEGERARVISIKGGDPNVLQQAIDAFAPGKKARDSFAPGGFAPGAVLRYSGGGAMPAFTPPIMGSPAYRRGAMPVGDLVVPMGDIDQKKFHFWIGMDRGWEKQDGEQPAPVSFLYERPPFEYDPKLFTNLTQYAPGLHNTLADIYATLEAEADVEQPAPGAIDADARRLIERARAADWQALTVAADGPLSGYKVYFNGTGQFAYERMLGSGLGEQVVCDGKTLWHLYPEIGLAAKRPFSRHHLHLAAAINPAFLPAADELARGHDVKALGSSTIALAPLWAAELGKDDRYARVHLVFSSDGRLSERRIVEMPAGKTLLTQFFRADGTIEWQDADGKSLGKETRTLAPAQAPNLAPKTANLVVMPMPIRSRSYWLAKQNTDSSDYVIEQTYISEAVEGGAQNSAMIHVLKLHAKGDRRLGLYTLLNATGYAGVPETLRLTDKDAAGPLGLFLVQAQRELTSNDQSAYKELPGAKDGFLQRLTRFRNLWLAWHTQRAVANPGELPGEYAKVIEFLQNTPSPTFAYAVLDAMQRRSNRPPTDYMTEIAVKRFGPISDPLGLGYVFRYEHARALWQAGKAPEAGKLFKDLHADTLKYGLLPPIDSAYRSVLQLPAVNEAGFIGFTRKTLDDLLAKKRFGLAFQLARQMDQLGDEALSDEILAAILDRASSEERNGLTLLSAGFQTERKHFVQADRLLARALEDKDLAKHPGLWRWREQVSRDFGQQAASIACLEKTLDLEYADLPELVNVESIRTDYRTLLNHYQTIAEAGAALTPSPSPGGRGEHMKAFLAKVIRAADRWRLLDQDSAEPSMLAGKIFHTLGERELAWDYWTTPIDLHPAESKPWIELADTLKAIGDLEKADKAYRLAFEAEPTNPEILWQRAQNQVRMGQSESARRLYQQIADGAWQERFAGTVQQARGLAVK
jgi:tetratricopeptide (TPR) repeat protein